MFKFLKKMDWVMIVSAILLVVIGLFSIHSSSLAKNSFSNFQKQLFFFGVGIVLIFLLEKFKAGSLFDFDSLFFSFAFFGFIAFSCSRN